MTVQEILTRTVSHLEGAMSSAEAKSTVDTLCHRVFDRWEAKVTGGRFMRELLAGTLPVEAIRLFWKNWYYFVSEINNFHNIAFQRHLGWLKVHPELYAAYAAKVADELMHPTPPGHIQILLEQGRTFGLRDEEMIHCQMLPECRAWTDWFRGLVYEGTLAEWWACHTAEEMIGHWARRWREALGSHYGFGKENVLYFKVHEEADLETHEEGILGHGEFNRMALQKVLEDGLVYMRPGFSLSYVALVTVDYAALFFEGVYREFKGESSWGWR